MQTTDPQLMPHVLVVEDQELMRETLVGWLDDGGFRVTAVSHGAQALESFERDRPVLMVVDWMLPDMEGTEIVRRLSGEEGTGMVMLTGRGALEHRLEGMELGADAYLVKPVDERELLLTLRAVLRRLDVGQVTATAATGGAYRFEPRRFRLTSPQGTVLELNAQECVLVECLLRRPGEVVVKEALMEALGAHGDAWGEPRLAQTVSRLRRKLEAACPGWEPLRTVHRVGYAFQA